MVTDVISQALFCAHMELSMRRLDSIRINAIKSLTNDRVGIILALDFGKGGSQAAERQFPYCSA